MKTTSTVLAMMIWRVALLFLAPAHAALLRSAWRNATSNASRVPAPGAVVEPGSMTIPAYYEAHKTGRGIWKWSNALDAYQQLLTPFIGKKVLLAEVGVQSGGSIEMWKAALGPGCHVYGLDINPACNKFKDPTTTITIGDQGDENMWKNFYTTVTAQVDVLIDDGSHKPEHMGTTLYSTWPHIKPGGFVAIEDIHGEWYISSFYWYSANWIHFWHEQAQVESVHLYPFMFVVKKSMGHAATLPAVSTQVSDFQSLWTALPNYPGGTVALKNDAWGSLLSQPSLYNIFKEFNTLNAYGMSDVPAGCARTAAVDCTAYIANSHLQAAITEVAIYPSELVVHVANGPPVIRAVRKGNDWLPY